MGFIKYDIIFVHQFKSLPNLTRITDCIGVHLTIVC